MLDALHWLPFRQWIIFQIAALVWQCLQDLASSAWVNFVVPPRVAEVSVPSALWNKGVLLWLSHLKIPGGPKMARAALSRQALCSNVAAEQGDASLLFGG